MRLFLFFVLTTIFIWSCKKNSDSINNTANVVPVISTNPVTSFTSASFVGGGNITSDGGVQISDRGICWSTSQNPAVTGEHISSGSGTGSFTVTVSGLAHSTIYHVRAYAVNANGTYYGNDITVSTT